MAQAREEFYIEDLKTTVEVTAWFSKYRYGADADGNRWEWRYEIIKTEYTIPNCRDNGERLTATEKLECEIELQKKLEKFNDWGLIE